MIQFRKVLFNKEVILKKYNILISFSARLAAFDLSQNLAYENKV